MRPVSAFWLSLALFSVIAAYTQLVANSRYLEHASLSLRTWAESLPAPTADKRQALLAETKQRVLLYDDEIIAQHLLDGMVVNRKLSGLFVDECDSLLFSSLRFASLSKLGLTDRASTAWQAIQRSKIDGRWLRHPQCHESTSRDMILGLLIALSQQPPGFSDELRELVHRVRDHSGYFGDGPIYVSYLTPTVAKLMAMLAPVGQLEAEELPGIVRDGYSTNELQLLVTEQGFQAHLIALSVWLEMELEAKGPKGRSDRGIWEQTVNTLVAPFASNKLHQQRLDWTTYSLVQLAHRNLFFRYLRLRAASALTPTVAHGLLAELLKMPQFPKDRLPMNCDRRADYLWQRTWRDFVRLPTACTEQFHGTDFLWMAALLTEAMDVQPSPGNARVGR